MSFGNSTSVDRDTLREQQRKARAQLADIKDVTSAHPLGLFGEPIKVAPSSDDPLGKRIKKTLGEYDAMKETISSNPKNLIGITRQPPTPLPTQLHHEPPSFPRPHQQHQQQHGSSSRQRRNSEVRSHSSSRSNRDVDSRHQSHHSRTSSSSGGGGNVVFARPKSVSQSSKHLPQTSQSDSNVSVSSQSTKLATGSKSSSSPLPVRETPPSSSSSSRDRDRTTSQVQHRHPYPSLSSKHSHASNPSEQHLRTNGSLKPNYPRGSSSTSVGVKPTLKLKIDSQVKNEESVGAQVEDILKEMIAPTPLSGIPTPRKQESKFPFPNTSNEIMNVHTSHSKAKSVCRSLDLSSSLLPSSEKATTTGLAPPPPLSAGILKEDLAISEDSDDEVGTASRKGSSASSGFAISCGTAVLTNPPPPLAAMSPNSESSSSDSEASSSGSDSEENSNRSHESEASDDESRPPSPKPDQIWNLDNFIKSTSQSVPFGLPSDPPAVHDQESQSYDVGLCTPIKDDDDGGFCSVPDILSKDFSKEDIKDLIPSPPPEPLGSIDDFCGESGELISKAMEDVPPISSPMSPPSPSTKIVSKKQHQQLASVDHTNLKKASSSSLLDKAVKKHSSSKHVKDVFAKKNGLINDKIASTSVRDGQKSSSSQKVAGETVKHRRSNDKRRESSEGRKKDSLSAVYKKSRSSNSSSKNPERVSKRDVDHSTKNRSSESPAYQRRPPSSPMPSKKTLTETVFESASSPKATTPSNSTVSKNLVSSVLPKSDKKVLSTSQSLACKKVAQEKKSRSQQPQKFKSKEYISDTGDSSDSESEIVDVVGTPSPVKMGLNGKATKSGVSKVNSTSITATIASVSSIAASSKPLPNVASPLHKKKLPSKHLFSKSKELSSSSSSISSSASSCDGASVSHVKRQKSPKKSPFVSSEDLTAKTAPLSPIRDKLSSSRSPAMKVLSSLSDASGSNRSSVIVKLDINLLERVPPYPPISRVLGSRSVVLSSSHVAKQKGNARTPRSEEKSSGSVLDDRSSTDVIPTQQHKPKLESKSIKRRNSNGDSKNSDKKRKFKVSTEDMGSNSSLSSTSSVKGVHKSRSSKVKEMPKESNESLNEKSASIEQRIIGGDVLFRSTEDVSGLPITRGTGSSDNKISLKDKNVDVSNEVEKKEMPTPARSSRDREIQLPTREDPPVAQSELEYNRLVNREGAISSIPNHDDVTGGGETPNFEADSQISSIQSLAESSGKAKRIVDNTEPDFKRRKADIPVSSQTSSKWEPPKSSNIDSIERNTNHDRILPVARVRPNTDCITNPKRKCIELNEELSSTYYLAEAVKLKHEADKETDRTKQTMLYLEAVLYFILTGEAMEREHLKEHIVYQMFRKTVDLIKYVATNNKFRGHQTTLLNENINTRLSVLSMRCQSLLHLKLFNMKKKDFHECQRFLSEHQKSSSGRSTMTSPQQSSSMMLTSGGLSTATVWNPRSTGTPSPMSPLPSPAGSVGSVESQSSGYSSPKLGPQAAKLCNGTVPSVVMPPMSHLQPQPPATVTIPANLHSAMLQQLSNYQHLLSCHEVWDQADIATVRGRSEEFFAALDQQYGKLTLHSSLRELIRYVQHGLYPLKGNT